MNAIPLSLIVGLLAGLAVVLVALWRGWLTRGGAAAALAVGGITLGFGGLPFVVPLLIFFVTSSILSKVRNAAKRSAEKHFDKSSKRDAVQVLANGGLGALAALGFGLTQDPRWFICFVGIMATATADTWATELGTLSRSAPRSVISGRSVAPGMSGGVSLLGFAASIAGGALIGCVGGLSTGGLSAGGLSNVLGASVESLGWLVIVGGVAGLAGSLIDSLLGATLQRHYWDPLAEELTEKAVMDGQPLELQRGLAWMNNDVVNLLAALGGGLVALGLG